MLRSFRPSRVQFFTKLLLPAIVPVILTSWKINLSLAIRVVTIAELVGAISGVGYGLAIAQELFSVADVFAWTLVLVVILFLAEAVLSVEEAHAAMADMRTDAAESRSAGCANCFGRPLPATRWWRSSGSTSASAAARWWRS